MLWHNQTSNIIKPSWFYFDDFVDYNLDILHKNLNLQQAASYKVGRASKTVQVDIKVPMKGVSKEQCQINYIPGYGWVLTENSNTKPS